MFLYKIQPVRPPMLTEGSTETESRTVSEHFDYLKDLTEKGTVILAGRTQNKDCSSFGIVIFKAESEEIAREIMSNDPAVKNRVFRAELFPYKNSAIQTGKRAVILPIDFLAPARTVGPRDCYTVEVKAFAHDSWDQVLGYNGLS